MRLDARAFGFAAGFSAAVLFVMCALGVAVAPEATTAFAGMLIHADLTGIIRTLAFGTFVGGLICWSLGTTLACRSDCRSLVALTRRRQRRARATNSRDSATSRLESWFTNRANWPSAHARLNCRATARVSPVGRTGMLPTT
jgi:hypothetical protein